MDVISKRGQISENWEDFLVKHLHLCLEDQYHEEENPKGYINLGTAVNNMCNDIIFPRLTSEDVWRCDTDLLGYVSGYGIARLRHKIAVMMTEFLESSEPIHEDEIICSPGAGGAIDLVAHCLADPGDVFLAPTPIYGRVYTDMKQRAEVKMWPIPIISEDTEELSPVLTIDKVKKAYHEAKAQNQKIRGVFLVNPNNPLGDVYSPELLMEILTFCHEYNLHTIIDEVYALSVFPDGPPFHSILKFPRIPDPDRTHVIYGLSKDFTVAGLRIGIIYSKCEALRRCLRQLVFLHSIAHPIMGITANFIEDLEWCMRYVTINKQRLGEKFNFCKTRLQQMGLNVRDSYAGFFLWVDFRPICGSKSFAEELKFFNFLLDEMQLYIVPGKELFCAQPGWFRISFAGNPDHVEEGLNRLERGIEKYAGKNL